MSIVDSYANSSIFLKGLTHPDLIKEVGHQLDDEQYSQTKPFLDSFRLHSSIFPSSFNTPECILQKEVCLKSIVVSSDLLDDIQDCEPHIKAMTDLQHSNALNMTITLLMLSISQLHQLCESAQYNTLLTYFMKATEGQYLDINNKSSSFDEYLHMVSLKSGSLLAITNLLATDAIDEQTRDIIAQYSIYLGISAQIVNDIKDVFNFDSKSDWKLKRKTLPILFLLDPEVEGGQLVRDYYNGVVSFDDFYCRREEVITTLKQLGAIPFAAFYKNRYDNKAKSLIAKLDISDDQKSLLINKLIL